MNALSERNRWFVVFAVIVVVAIVAGSAWLIDGGSTKADTPVVLYDSSVGGAATPTEFQRAGAAAGEASRRAGFTLNLPAYLPKGFAVADISISPKPPALSGSTLSRLSLAIKSGGATLTMLAVNSPFTFPGDDASHIVATPAKGANIYKNTGEGLAEYTLLTPTRGYVLAFKATALSEAEALKVLSSLPML